MYKYIKASRYPDDEGGLKRTVHHVVAKLINDQYGSKLYGKIMNMQSDTVIPYIEGIMAMAELANIDIAGLNDFYELLITEGVGPVIRADME